jgi:hypothetical protein
MFLFGASYFKKEVAEFCWLRIRLWSVYYTQKFVERFKNWKQQTLAHRMGIRRYETLGSILSSNRWVNICTSRSWFAILLLLIGKRNIPTPVEPYCGGNYREGDVAGFISWKLTGYWKKVVLPWGHGSAICESAYVDADRRRKVLTAVFEAAFKLIGKIRAPSNLEIRYNPRSSRTAELLLKAASNIAGLLSITSFIFNH